MGNRTTNHSGDVLRELFPNSKLVSHEASTGHQTHVFFTDHEVLKVVGNNELVFSNATEAYELALLITEYHSKLQELSPDIAPDYCSNTVQPISAHGDILLINISPDHGMDLQEAMVQEVVTPKEALRSILEILELIFPRVDGYGLVPLGIDAKPANFCFNPDTFMARYIDLIPPRFNDNGRLWVEYPYVESSHGVWKFYSPLGILLTTLSQFTRLFPEHWELFVQEMVEWVVENGWISFAQSLLVITDIIDLPAMFLELDNPILLRLAACKIAFYKPYVRPLLEDFFTHLTHYRAGSHEPAFWQAKVFLLRALWNGL